MAKKYWMKDVNPKKGKLTRKAKAAGESITEFCSRKHDRSTTAECNLAKVFRRSSKKRHKRPSRRSARRG